MRSSTGGPILAIAAFKGWPSKLVIASLIVPAHAATNEQATAAAATRSIITSHVSQRTLVVGFASPVSAAPGDLFRLHRQFQRRLRADTPPHRHTFIDAHYGLAIAVPKR